jgi:hypothetical protein
MTNVDQLRDAMLAKQRNQLVEGPRRVSDRKQAVQAASAARAFARSAPAPHAGLYAHPSAHS